MPRYSPERKHAVLAKLLPPHSQPVTLVSRSDAYSGEREHLYRRNVNTHFPTH